MKFSMNCRGHISARNTGQRLASAESRSGVRVAPKEAHVSGPGRREAGEEVSEGFEFLFQR